LVNKEFYNLKQSRLGGWIYDFGFAVPLYQSKIRNPKS